jgi:hypothetical protein
MGIGSMNVDDVLAAHEDKLLNEYVGSEDEYDIKKDEAYDELFNFVYNMPVNVWYDDLTETTQKILDAYLSDLISELIPKYMEGTLNVQ